MHKSKRVLSRSRAGKIRNKEISKHPTWGGRKEIPQRGSYGRKESRHGKSLRVASEKNEPAISVEIGQNVKQEGRGMSS